MAVVNPRSANGATGRRWPKLARALGRALGALDTVFTVRPGDGIALAREAVERGAELVVSVGGDGTHNEVVNGLFDARGPRNPEAALAVIPAGTGGDLARSLGLPARAEEAIARLGAQPPGARRRIDVGRVELTGPAGAPVTRYFLNVSSFGVSARVVEVVNRSGKWLGGKLSFALGSVRALQGYRDQRISLRLDESPAEELAVTTVAVATGRVFRRRDAGRAMAAVLDDGALEDRSASAVEFTPVGLRLQSGEAVRRHPPFLAWRAQPPRAARRGPRAGGRGPGGARRGTAGSVAGGLDRPAGVLWLKVGIELISEEC